MIGTIITFGVVFAVGVQVFVTDMSSLIGALAIYQLFICSIKFSLSVSFKLIFGYGYYEYSCMGKYMAGTINAIAAEPVNYEINLLRFLHCFI